MDPRVEYGTRKAARSTAVAAADARYSTVSNLRVAMVIATIASAWWAHAHEATLFYAAPFVLAFLALVIAHGRIDGDRKERVRAVAYYTRAERRLAGGWQGHGDEGTSFVPPHHPYAFDVDAFGRGSLFQLLCEPRTQSGDRMLASWLLYPAATAEIRLRQRAVAELSTEVDLRELLAMHADDSRSELDLDDLRAWAERPPSLQQSALRWAALVVGLGTLAAAVASLGYGVSVIPVLALASAGSLITRGVARDVHAVTSHLAKTRAELQALMHVLSCFSGRKATAPWLALRYSRIAGAERVLTRLMRLIDWLESRRHQLFAPIAYLVLWTPLFTFAIEDWRKTHGRDVLDWLRVAGELEAASVLARHAFEHPDDVFPEILDATTAQLVTESARHPLMDEQRCVANSLSLASPMQLYLVSGSNMSGKSTLLRTIGLNVVLALAGAPVRAGRFSLTPLQVAATLRVQDSLQEGASRFFAEIARLKIVADCAASGPTLFLLDEILSGTNSHDRRIGTDAVVRSFLERHAIGFVTTHDLALTDIVGTLGDRATNVHFEDQMVDGSLHFDYTMRPGVVQKSNAIELMRQIGLEV